MAFPGAANSSSPARRAHGGLLPGCVHGTRRVGFTGLGGYCVVRDCFPQWPSRIADQPLSLIEEFAMAERPRVILSGFADEAANHKTAVEQFAAFAAMGLQYYTIRFMDAAKASRTSCRFPNRKSPIYATWKTSTV